HRRAPRQQVPRQGPRSARGKMTDDASALCRSCGLCCDGTLFTFVRLDAADASRARASKLVVVTGDAGAESLRQPCAALSGRECSVYAARPSACSRYECLLLAALRSGETSLAEASAIVAETHRLAASGSDAGEGTRRHF